MSLPRLLVTALLVASPTSAPPTPPPPPAGSTPASIAWQPWRDGLFTRAAGEHRLVILDLEAVWCHWCHVMASTTYQDPRVVTLLTRSFISARVDQDANPELSNRYGDWGWPATVIFSSDGRELVKHRGYIEPDEMVELLQQALDHPGAPPPPPREVSPGPGHLSAEQAGQLWQTIVDAYDTEHGGFGRYHRFLDGTLVELLLRRASAGDCTAEAMARKTLSGTRRLIDPVWGGMYQYSDSVDWSSPHFEKIASIQADALRIHALAFALLGAPEDRTAALAVASYLERFFTSPDGSFFTSQDADVRSEDAAESVRLDGHQFYKQGDAARRASAQPALDRHSYTRENGWLISALASASGWLSDPELLAPAEKAARWLLEHRAQPGGGFRHGEQAERPCLGDTLAAGQAFLDLYAATAERPWLAHAREAASALRQLFPDRRGGFFTCVQAPRSPLPPIRDVDENAAAARFLNGVYHYTGDPTDLGAAQSALAYLTSSEVLARRGTLAQVLLADQELASDPLHIAVVGSKAVAAAQALFATGAAAPTSYRRLEWWDRAEGPLPLDDVPYPALPKPAAFTCSGKACSLPAFEPIRLEAAIRRSLAGTPSAGSPSNGSVTRCP